LAGELKKARAELLIDTTQRGISALYFYWKRAPYVTINAKARGFTMGKNRGRGNSRKKRPLPKPAVQVVRPQSSSQMIDSAPRRRFHIDWTQVNFWQIIILFFAPLLFSIVVVVPILSGFHHLRPEAAIIAEPFVTFILVVTGLLAAGFINIRKIDLFNPQRFRLKQAVLALVSGIVLSLVLLGVAIPPPSSQATTKPIPTVNTACLATPTLTAPVDGQSLTSRTVIMTWEAPQGCVPDGYTVRITLNQDPDAKPWIVDTGWAPTDYTHTFTADGTYYWHIRACKPCTPFHPGAWAIRSFTIHTSSTH
jgi:hypothetical protein